jgi:hypothetical protein
VVTALKLKGRPSARLTSVSGVDREPVMTNAPFVSNRGTGGTFDIALKSALISDSVDSMV